MVRFIFVMAVLLSANLCSLQAFARQEPTCKTPRNTADSVFAWQLGDKPNITFAAKCLERTGRKQAQLEETARRLKVVYDSRGAFVNMDTISDDAKYLSPGSHAARVIPHPELPQVAIEKRGEVWLWTKSSLDWVDGHYRNHLQGLDRLIEFIPKSLKSTVLDVQLWQYLALLLLLIVGLFVRNLIRVVVAARLKQLGKKLGQQWTSRLVDVVDAPGATLVTAIILRVGYPRLRLPIDVASSMSTVVKVLVILSIFWALYRGVDLIGAKLAQRAERTDSKLDDQLVPLVRKSLKIVVFLVGSLMVLQNFTDVRALLAGLSIGGLAVGLAAKDTLANLFGSISIFVDSPFQIGDWISVGGTDGTVEEVGFRSTRLRTFYNSVVVLPNATLADAKIDNYGRREYRRCFVTLGLTYDTSPDQVQAFVEGVRAVIRANEYTRKDTYEVHFSGFGDSSLNIMVYFFFRCETWTDELRERHNVFLEIMRLADSIGVSFAFPTQSLHIESLAASGKRDLPPSPSPKTLRQSVHDFGPGGDRSRPDGPHVTRNKYVASSEVDRGDYDDDDAGEGADGGN